MLTPGQVAHFQAFGFLVLRNVFTPEDMNTIEREANEIMEEVRGGAPFEGKERQAVQPFFERRPFTNTLMDDDRIYSIGEDLLGPDFVLDQSEGNLHVGDTVWHGGRSWEILPWIKIGFYLEPLTRDTGCLRVIPGSHIRSEPDYYEPLRQGDAAGDVFGLPQAEIPSVALECGPGDLIVFTENILHASFGGRPGRHQHAISFFKNPTTDSEVQYVLDVYNRTRFTARPLESHINSDRPRVRRMISRLLELGFEPLPY